MKRAASEGLTAARFLRTLLVFVLASYICIPSGVSFADEGDEPAQSEDLSEFSQEASDVVEDEATSDDALSEESSASVQDEEPLSDDEEDSQTEEDSASAASPDDEPKSEAAPDQDGQENDIDLAVFWQSGEAVVDAAGSYVLGSDVSAHAPLKVVLPQGAEATIDLAGHDVTVDVGDASSDSCAIDLSENAGSIKIIDSKCDPADFASGALIKLVTKEPQRDCAVVSDVRSSATKGAVPSASFKDVRLVAQANLTEKAAEEQGFGTVSVARTDVDEDWQTPGSTVSLSFENCLLDVEVIHDAFGTESDSPEESDLDVLSASIVDARCPGVQFDGACAARMFEDGTKVTDDRPQLLSHYEASFSFGPDYPWGETKQGKTGSDLPADAGFVFGFPEKTLTDGAETAKVAVSLPGKSMSDEVKDLFKAESGYEMGFEVASGDENGIVSASLMRPSEEAVESIEAGELDQEAVEVVQSDEAQLFFSASEPESSESAVAEFAETNLSEAWKAQEGGLEKSLTITEGGTYYLSADLKTESNLIIDAAGQDVVLKFNGHDLTIDGAGAALHKTMLQIANASSVVLDGSSSIGESSLTSAGELDVWGVSCEASNCTVSMNDLKVTLKTTVNTQRNLSTHAVRAEAGTLRLSRCTVVMDMGNQSLKSTSLLNDKDPETPSAVYATPGTNSVVLVDCTVTGIGSRGFFLVDVSDTDIIGNAYALYSLAESTVVQGGSYKAVSALGSATCLYGSTLRIKKSSTSNSVKLEADASQIASGILSKAAASVVVEAPLDFTVDSDFADAAQVQAVFRTGVNDGFVFGSCLPMQTACAYTALVLKTSDLQGGNAQGSVVGTFHADLSQDERAAIAAVFSNALPQGACDLVSDGNRVLFQLDEANAVACINGESYYSTIQEALSAFTDGSTLTLLADAGALGVSKVANGTLDLNGYSISSLEYSAGKGTENDCLVVKNGSISGTMAANSARASVYHHSTSSLTLSNVSIAANEADANVYGVYADKGAGTLSLTNGTTVCVRVARVGALAGVSAYGVGMPSKGPKLILDGASISVTTPSADVGVYGLYSSVAATVLNSTVAASGTTGTTCAAYVGGNLEAVSSAFDAYTSGVAGTACGVWARTSTPKATSVSIDSCMVFVRSAASDLSGSIYACLLGATSETGAVAPSKTWLLSGSNTFRSAGGVHLGLNVGDVQLGADFGLSPLSDNPLVISQSQRQDDIGIVLDASATEQQAADLAELFAAKAGSNYDGWRFAVEWRLVTVEGKEDKERRLCLVWHPDADVSGQGVVAVIHNGTQASYPSLSAALSAAESGDTVKLLADLAESGTAAISQNDLYIDLDGHTLTLRAGVGAKATSPSAGGAVSYRGTGTLGIQNGTLNIQVGSATEPTTGATYQGVAVTGGGTLTIDAQAIVNVSYVGSSTTSAVQRSVIVRGVAITNGKLSMQGALNVQAAQADGVVGAMNACGVFAESSSSARADVDIASAASVQVVNSTGVKTTKNTYYPEVASGVAPQGGPSGLREITIDPEHDADFYQEVLRQFRISATYDDPNDTTQRNTFNASIYYADGMTLSPEDTSAWYYGLRVWAYSDEVATADVGKSSVIVPTHIFVASPFEELPEAYGVVTSSQCAGTVNVSVKGSISTQCAHGDAFALNAYAAKDSAVTWLVDGSSLDAQADKAVHLFAGDKLDLRDYIELSSSQPKRVAYAGATNAQVVKFGTAKACDVVVDGNASLTIDGSTAFTVTGGQVSNVEASAINVGSSFKLAGGDSVCTVSNETGANKSGDAFAFPENGARLKAGLFADAYDECDVDVDKADGSCVWAEGTGYTVTFKVGDAVVARYKSPLFVNLSEPSAAAVRVADQRQNYRLLGWSENPDENATSGYLSSNANVITTQETVYYAVFGTDMTSVPVRFSNVHDAGGQILQPSEIMATYGQTVGEALAAAKQSLPEPKDYTDDVSGVTYRFAGWYVSGGSNNESLLLYSSEMVSDLEVTLNLNGVSSGALTLYAGYLATDSDQHMVTFVVDGYRTVCVVNDGEHPVYTASNSTNSNYVEPSKQTTEDGKTYSFSSWFVDEDGDGELGVSEKSYSSVLPAAHADAVYTADFAWKWSDVTYTFYIKYITDSNIPTIATGMKPVATTYEKPSSEIADSVAKIGSSLGLGGRVYTLDGWSIRRTDVDPLYTDSSQLPSLSSGERMLNSTYVTTYYGVYSVSDHKVEVSFFEGENELGKAEVVASSTAVNTAFNATGATTPADKSQDEVFLGWATSPDATSALAGSSTMIETLAPGAQESLELYAVFGSRPSYQVRLRTADGSKVLYQVSVKRGDTVVDALAQANVTVSVPSQEGSYFKGWRSAGGAEFSLDSPVEGAGDYYAEYAEVIVDSFDSADIDAVATVSYESSSAAEQLDDIESITFKLTSRDSADTPLRTATAKNSYSILKNYDMRLIATTKQGTTSQITGEFGTVQLKVYVGTKYRNAKVRAFWLGTKNGNETVMNSAVKDVDSDGYITLSIGNFIVGDEYEGGNLAIAYIEGGTSSGSLSSDEVEGGSSLTVNDPAGSTINSSNLSGSLGANALGSNTLGGSTLGSNLLGGSLSTGSSLASGSLTSTLSSGSSSSGLSATGSSSSGLSSSSGSALASSSDAGLSAESKSGGENGGLDGDSADVEESQAWGSEAWVFMLLAAGLLAALLRKLWLMFVVKPRRDEQEAEMPAMEEQHAEGIHF